MRTVKQIILGLFILILIVVTAGIIFLQNLKTAAIPDYNENIELPGLTDEVTVFRDEFGIPHVYAKTESDLYRAVGFVMAQDRLWQMDLLRRVTQGRLSEILGEEQVNTDLLMRSLRIQEKSEKIIKIVEPDIVYMLQAFADGVNHYIQHYPLPPEFKVLGYNPEPWKPVESVNLIGYMSWDLTSGWGTEFFIHQLKDEVSANHILELLPCLKQNEIAVYPDFGTKKMNASETLLSASFNLEKLGVEVFQGSNNWAISGAKSNTGKPLLANDMHLGLFAPGIWYQMHQYVEGKLHVTGLVLPGQPAVIAGHNDSIAWGMTNVMVDDLDFYKETLNADSTKYLLDGVWKDLIIRTEKIHTKEGEIIEKVLKFTHRGPIVNQFKNENETPISIRWIGNEMSNEIRTVYKLNRAKNWIDFRDAVKSFKSVSQNIVYADAAGNIGLQCSAGIPVREGSGIQIYPGDSSKYDWTGLVPFEELPFEYNPERGYVSSANNKTAPGDYPYYISHWFATSDRIDRIREMLEEREKLGISDFEKMHADFKSKKAQEFTPEFLNVLNTIANFTETEKTALKFLQNWNYQLVKESQAATIFEIMYRKICENLVKDELTPKSFKTIKGERTLLENLMVNGFREKKSAWANNNVQDFNNIITESFKQTVSDLTASMGEDVSAWKWGKIHTFTIGHPLGVVRMLDKALQLNKGPFEMPGSFHTVCPYSYSYNNLYNVNHGASHRHIFDVGNWDNSKTILPTGTSGIPASDFYLDQTERYLNNEYHNDFFGFGKVSASAKYSMRLMPKL